MHSSTSAARLVRALVLLALATIGAIAQDDRTLDDLYDEVFNEDQNLNIVLEPPASTRQPQQQAACLSGQRCVQKYLCSNDSVTGAVGIDIRFDEGNPCGDYLLQCCYEEDIIANPVTQRPVIVDPNPSKCGKRNPDGIGFKIINDNDGETEYGEFPWMMAVLKQEPVLDVVMNVQLCGGSLIHPRVVLTVAHYVQNKKPADLKVRGGEWDTQTLNEIYLHQDRDVAEIIVHPQYYKAGLHNDIALLLLTAPFNLDEGIQTICLPPPGTLFDHQRCFASGWGRNVFGKPDLYQAILKKVELPIVPSAQCQAALRTTRVGPRFELHKSFICAGGEAGLDTCKGDGGAPLVCPIQGSVGHFYQAGIVAWGVGCGEKQIPGVYTGVAQFRSWIDQQLQQRQIDSHSYSY